ncbi:MAG TPA: 2-amino-4-hydroxy-6-hydroxymethyldihydropteridine diphosphokinase [Planctomycetes bacterium]|nr:2-amino-4-hydroxy-6-hydroxymethyldihydropteridine diphosphokinase [Planctomycetota bacterium]HIN79702.1 2-amino-4-hydroxy-6-hydroxymethyldihydropteridine diphosphokinase [Planctomycetota bacterium]
MTPSAVDVRLALGSNEGDRQAMLRQARQRLVETGIVADLRESEILETEAVGPPQGAYLNQVVAGVTTLEAPALLEGVKRIEKELGRVPGVRWGPRPIDIDILVLGDLRMREPGLSIPHRGIESRRFVLEPWATLERDFPVPSLGSTVGELLARLETSKQRTGDVS